LLIPFCGPAAGFSLAQGALGFCNWLMQRWSGRTVPRPRISLDTEL
jgi:hypothetical protein